MANMMLSNQPFLIHVTAVTQEFINWKVQFWLPVLCQICVFRLSFKEFVFIL